MHRNNDDEMKFAVEKTSPNAHWRSGCAAKCLPVSITTSPPLSAPTEGSTAFKIGTGAYWKGNEVVEAAPPSVETTSSMIISDNPAGAAHVTWLAETSVAGDSVPANRQFSGAKSASPYTVTSAPPATDATDGRTLIRVASIATRKTNDPLSATVPSSDATEKRDSRADIAGVVQARESSPAGRATEEASSKKHRRATCGSGPTKCTITAAPPEMGPWDGATETIAAGERSAKRKPE